jgi:predicted phage terminase large subunit-like protein
VNLDDPKTIAHIRHLIKTRGHEMSLHELELLERELAEYEVQSLYARARVSFLAFCHLVYPGFKEGPHHRLLAPLLENIAFGHSRFLAVSISPRHGKTEFISFLFAAWYMGIHSGNKLMMATHTASLSADVGRKVRNLIDEDIYQKIFPSTRLAKDSKAADAWSTSDKGTAYYTGVGGALAGRGANLLLVDDPHNEQDALSGNPKVFDEAYEWYGLAFQRLQAKGACVIIHTRWARNDLIGRVMEQAVKNPLAPQYKYVELPMELPSGQPLWPEMFDLDDIQTIKNAIPPHRWMAQYQQQPTNAINALVPASAWQRWTKAAPPEILYTYISLDAAIEANKRSDYSVFAVFGVFIMNHTNHVEDEEKPNYQVMLLDVVRDRMEYPELKRTAIAMAEKWVPDKFIIEKKASGAPLLQDLRRMRLPVAPFEPVKDKYGRLQMVSDVFDEGAVWAPEGYRWAEDYITEVANFPNDTKDDCVDTLSQFLTFFKKSTFSSRKLQWDKPVEDDYTARQSKSYYRVRGAA